MTRPLITVLGAHGAEGASLVAALLDDPARRYAVRAVTRPTGPAAAWTDRGCEVVAAEPGDRRSLAAAFDGAHGVFVPSDVSPARRQDIAAAAAAARVAHVVVCVAPHPVRSKPERSFLEQGLPVTFLHAGWAWERLIDAGMGPLRAGDGVLELALPMGDAVLPGIATVDIGQAAAALFARRTWVLGQAIGIAGDRLDAHQMAAAIARAIGEPVRPAPLPPSQYAALGFDSAAVLAEELAGVLASDADVRRDIAATRMLNPDTLDFDAWLARQAHRIPVPAAARRA